MKARTTLASLLYATALYAADPSHVKDVREYITENGRSWNVPGAKMYRFAIKGSAAGLEKGKAILVQQDSDDRQYGMMIAVCDLAGIDEQTGDLEQYLRLQEDNVRNIRIYTDGNMGGGADGIVDGGGYSSRMKYGEESEFNLSDPTVRSAIQAEYDRLIEGIRALKK